MNGYLENDKQSGFYRYILLVFILLFISLLTFSQVTWRPEKVFNPATWNNTNTFQWRKLDITSAEHFAWGSFISFTGGMILEDGFNFRYGYEAGAVIGGCVGFWKESTDYVGDWSDLTFTIAGSLAGYYVNKQIQKWYGLSTTEQLQRRIDRLNRKINRKTQK
jgi:opacity protein-like surface antigen